MNVCIGVDIWPMHWCQLHWSRPGSAIVIAFILWICASFCCCIGCMLAKHLQMCLTLWPRGKVIRTPVRFMPWRQCGISNWNFNLDGWRQKKMTLARHDQSTSTLHTQTYFCLCTLQRTEPLKFLHLLGYQLPLRSSRSIFRQVHWKTPN